MLNLIINYHTGITESITVSDLDEAKQAAYNGIAYTQEKVSIQTTEGETITESHWYGVEPDEDDLVLVTVGNGFYQLWSDELE
jgi:hypothetical protein